MWWPLWTSVAILVLMDTRTRAQRSQGSREYDPYKSSCFGCLPAAGAACDDVTVMTCEGVTPSCATTATTPSLSSQFICTPDAPPTQPCSLTFSEKTQTYNITCSCHHNYCASHFTEHLVRNLTKFAAANKVKDGQLIQEYLKFTTLSLLPPNELIAKLMNKAQILKDSSAFHETTTSEKVQSIDSNITVSPEVLNSELRRENLIESLPKAEALKHEATVPSDDDEDDGEGSGASEEGRGQRRPSAAAAPAAPSSFLPANTNAAKTNAAKKIYLTLTLFPFFIYIFT